ncbi:MAG: hypothetical protein KAI66_06870 [Lentisphaeria bacterium]|nr:hypothetical protein [Lentisphaeria bacterium]
MRWPVFALFHRSLLTESRGYGLYLRRCAMLVFVWFFLKIVSDSAGWRNAPGLQFFQYLMVINLVAITITGIQQFATAITEEKEEGTLVLLRMTALSPAAIMLGKSTSRLLLVLFLVLAQIPFTVLAVTLGGISSRQILAGYIVLTTYTIFLANMALFWSVLCRRGGSAAMLTGGTLFAYLVFPYWGREVLREMVRDGMLRKNGWVNAYGKWACKWLTESSPITQAGKILRTGYTDFPWALQATFAIAASVACFGLAWLLFDWTTRRPPAGASGLSRKAKKKKKTGSSAEEGAPRRPPSRLHRFLRGGRPPAVNALAWKEFHFGVGGWLLFTLRALAIFGLPVFFELLNSYNGSWYGACSRFDLSDYGEGLMGFALFGAGFEALFIGAGLFGREVRASTLQGLALLPISTTSLIFQKLWGALRPMLVYIAAVFTAFLLIPRHMFGDFGDGLGEPIFWGMIAMGLLTVLLVAYLSLVFKRGALAIALLTMFLGFMALGMFVGVSGGNLDEDSVALLMIMGGLMGATGLAAMIPPRLEYKAAEG